MASLFRRRKARELEPVSDLPYEMRALLSLAHQRVAAPLPWGHEPYAGLGDSATAKASLDALRGATHTAIRVIRERIQGLELGVFTRRFVNGDFEDTPAFGHPLQQVLDNPTLNPDDGSITHSAQQLWGLSVTAYKALGESYLIVIHDGAGAPVNLQYAVPGALQPIIQGGRIVGYEIVSVASGQVQGRLRPIDVVRIWNPDPYESFTPSGMVSRNSTLINQDQFANQHWEQFYRNDATPKLAFQAREASETMPDADQREAVDSTWRRALHRIVGNRKGTPGWVKPGWEVKELSSQNEAANGVAMMKHTRSIAFETLGVPTSMVGDVVDVNRAAAETTRYTFDVNTIEPITEMIAEALTLQLASQYPNPNPDNVRLIVKYRPFIARDKDFELRRDETDLRMKVRTVNEVRSSREPELNESSWGDLPVGTMAEVPYTGDEEPPIDLSGVGLEEPEEEPEEEPNPDEAETPEEEERARSAGRRLRAWFSPEREWARQLQRDQKWTPRFRTAQRALFGRQAEITLERFATLEGRSFSRQDDVDDLVEAIFPLAGWGALFQASTEPVRAGSYVDSGQQALDPINREFRMTEAAVNELNVQNVAHQAFTNRTTQDALRVTLAEGMSAGESVDQMAARIAETFGTRRKEARRIARTEVATAVQTAQEQGYEQSGVVEGKMWNTSLDGDVRDSHIIEGQTRRLGQDFRLANGERASGPAALELDPADRVNCRCFITPVFIDEDPATVL